MTKLESLVPPLELCQQIPPEAFADSALVWCVCEDMRGVISQVEIRALCDNACECFPAPTLAEIMEAFQRADFATSIFSCGVGWIAKAIKHNINEFKWAENPATAALRLWRELNKK